MKIPATTEGVPLMAVTMVRTVREPKPFTSIRYMAVARRTGRRWRRR